VEPEVRTDGSGVDATLEDSRGGRDRERDCDREGPRERVYGAQGKEEVKMAAQHPLEVSHQAIEHG
jgi:hypothetical protein